MRLTKRLVVAAAISALLTGAFAPAGPAQAGATTLAPPNIGSQTDVDQAFAELLKANGISTDEACFDLTQAVGATHVLEGSVSDETLACAVPANAAPGQELAGLVRGVRFGFATLTGGSVILSTDYDLYRLLLAWADQLDPCGSVWLAGTLGPINFPPYQAAALPLFTQQIAATWAVCSAPDPGDPGTSTDPGTGGGTTTPGGPGTVTPTYVQTVITRFTDQAKKRKNNPLSPHQAKQAARDCVKAEQAARAAGQLGKGERPCRDEIVFFPGADAGGAAIHDATAIGSHPSWAKLTYLSGPDKLAGGLASGWYSDDKYLTYADNGDCRPKPASRGVHCDEYPFYSTVEGGPDASLKEVPSAENTAEGNALNSMYQDADCQFVSGQTKFFVVPVAVPITVPEPDPATGAATTTTYAGPPSGHVCTPPAPVQAT